MAEEQEVEGLERVLHRLAMTDDEKLEGVLVKLLPIVIGKLQAAGPAVQRKVLDILSHVNKRLKPLPAAQLPLDALMQLYASPSATATVRNFAVVYIETAMGRATPKARLAQVGPLVDGISTRPAAHQEMLLRLAAQGLEHMDHHGNATALGGEAELAARVPFLREGSRTAAADRRVFLSFAERLMLYQPPSTKQHGSALAAAQAQMHAAAHPPAQQQAEAMDVDGLELPLPPAGLSRRDAAAVEGKAIPDAAVLQRRKLGMLNFTATAGIPPAEVLTLYLTASCDPADAVSRRGDELVKKRCGLDSSRPTVDLEKGEEVLPLFELFHGSLGDESMAEDARRMPASPALRGRLLSLFCKSIAAANCFPYTLTTVTECLYGSGTTARLRQQGMEFAVWVFKHADPAQLAPAAPAILEGCLGMLDSTAGGAGGQDSTALTLRSFTYQAVGQLAQRQGAALQGRTDVASQFFSALATEPPGVRAAVQEALSALATAFAGCSGDVAEEVLALLGASLQSREEAVRGAGLQWAVRLFPFGHVQARYLCIMAASDARFQLADAGVDGLRLEKFAPAAPGAGHSAAVAVLPRYPSLGAMLQCMLQRHPALGRPVEEGRSLVLPPKSFAAAVDFLERCRLQGGAAAVPEAVVTSYLAFLENALVREAPAELHATALAAMLAVAAAHRAAFSAAYSHRPSLFLRLLGHVDADARDAAARLLGTLCSHMPTEQAQTLLEGALSTLRGGAAGRKVRLEEADGAAAAVGYIAAQCVAGQPAVAPELLLRALQELRSRLEAAAADATLRSTAALALGCAALPLALPTPGQALSALPDAPAIVAAVAALLRDSEKGGKAAAKRAAQAVGFLCHSHRTAEVLTPGVAALLDLRACRHEEVLFAAGEALCFAFGGVAVPVDDLLHAPFRSLAGWLKEQQLKREREAAGAGATAPSAAAQSGGEVPVGPPSAAEEEVQASILRAVVDEYVSHSRPEVRCAGATWLVSLLSFCGRVPRVAGILPRAQDALCALLGDENELTQEMASRGLAACYELADAATRAALVDSLVGTLSGSAARKRRAGDVVGDTKVFEAGAMGSVPGGGSLSTYKEICALATDLGQPDLVYRFMQLANHQATVNASRGAAFGFASVAKLAGEALTPHVAQLVPRLYRSLYDPQPKVRDAMHHIWAALLDDPRAALTQHFDVVMSALLADMGGTQWRAREAAALAACDLLQGRRWGELRPHFAALWGASFRVMDDVKETVRQAGLALVRSVRGLTLGFADPEMTPAAEGKEAVAAALPLLLEKGLPSRVPEVQALAIDTTARLVKAAGPELVRPHLAALVPAMLESLSGLEDARLNYVEQHAERLGVDSGRLEAMRVSVAQGSPVGDTLDLCARYVDGPALVELTPRLAGLVRRGVGLSTRAGAGRFISGVARRLGADAAPAAPALMRALQEAARAERSGAVRRAYAAANAVLARHAAPSRVDKAVAEWLQLYAADDADPAARGVAGLLLRALAREAPDVFALHAAAVAPVAYLAQFDDDADVASVWGEVWEESTTSVGAGLRLHMRPVLDKVQAGLRSTQWGRKKAAAAAVVRVCEGAGDAVGACASELMRALLQELPGRLWDGKEAVLAAVGALSTACAAALRQDNPAMPAGVVAALLEAASKKRAAYKKAALEQLQAVLSAWKDEDHFREVAPLLLDLSSAFVAAQGGPKPMETSAPSSTAVGNGGTAGATSAEAVVPFVQVMGCLGAAWAAASSATVVDRAGGIAAALAAAVAAAAKVPDQAAAAEAAVRFAKRCGAAEGGRALQPAMPETQALLEAAARLATDGTASQLREHALTLVGALLQQLWAQMEHEERSRWVAALQEGLQREKLPALKSRAGALLAALQQQA